MSETHLTPAFLQSRRRFLRTWEEDTLCPGFPECAHPEIQPGMCYSSCTWAVQTVVWPSTTDLIFPGHGRVTARAGITAAARLQ